MAIKSKPRARGDEIDGKRTIEKLWAGHIGAQYVIGDP
jgi:hypothetical protein